MSYTRSKVQFDLTESEKLLTNYRWNKFIDNQECDLSVNTILYEYHHDREYYQHFEVSRARKMGVGYDELLLKKLQDRKATNNKDLKLRVYEF